MGETAVREIAVREIAVRETAVRETAVRETAVRETAVRETAVREIAVSGRFRPSAGMIGPETPIIHGFQADPDGSGQRNGGARLLADAPGGL